MTATVDSFRWEGIHGATLFLLAQRELSRNVVRGKSAVFRLFDIVWTTFVPAPHFPVNCLSMPHSLLGAGLLVSKFLPGLSLNPGLAIKQFRLKNSVDSLLQTLLPMCHFRIGVLDSSGNSGLSPFEVCF